MSLLFDVGEPRKPNARARANRGGPKSAETKSKNGLNYIKGFDAQPEIGRIDGHFTCGDSECLGQAFDIIREEERELEPRRPPQTAWLIECAFCGLMQWVPEIEGHLDEPEDDDVFRFRDGRYEGCTIHEVSRTPRGLEYLRWAAEKHPRNAVKDSCKLFLDVSGEHR